MRQNYVRIRILSKPFVPTSGVPQRSVLGPLLFLAFINDVVNCLNFGKVLLSGDDMKLFPKIQSTEDCENLRGDIFSISQWCTRNCLSL